jgi:WD40 repeat protein
VQLWNVESGQLVSTFRGHSGSAFQVVFSPDGTRLASAGADGSLKVWDTTPRRDTILILKRRFSTGILLNPDGRIAATGGGEDTIQLWNAANGERLGNPLKHEHKVINWGFTADGKRLALTDEGKNVTMWDVTTGKAVFSFKHDGPAGDVWTALSPDGKWFVCPGPAGVAKIWDSEKGLEFRAFKGLKGPNVEFSRDGTRIAALAASGTIKIWDLATGREICTTDLKDAPSISLRFSPDGKQLAVARSFPVSLGGLGEVRIIDAASGREVSRPVKGHSRRVTRLSFSPNGKRVATGGSDGTVKVWDVAMGQETLTLKGHTAGVTDLAFSPDGHSLISASWDGTVRIWDATPLPERP